MIKAKDIYKRSDLEEQLSIEFPNLSKKKISSLIDSIVDTIAQEVALDNKVEIRGFGTFSKKLIRPRKFVNPKTKEISF